MYLRRLAIVALILGLPGAARAADEIFAHFISVGQGDSTLFEFPGCGVMLIDAGVGMSQSARLLTDYLDQFFSQHPEYDRTITSIINTHPHYDHMKAIQPILDEYTVEHFIDNGYTPLRPVAETVREHESEDGSTVSIREIPDLDVIAEGYVGLTDAEIDPFSCPEMDPHITILSGLIEERPEDWRVRDYQNLNNHSLVTRVDFGLASFLFTGDLEDVAIDYMVDYYAGTGVLDIDIYQVGHHGSINGTTDSLLDEMTPVISIISMGVWNFGSDNNSPGTAWQYGHPREEVVRDLSSATTRRRSSPVEVMVGNGSKDFDDYMVRKAIYGTGWDGTIIVRAKRDGTYRVTVNN